MKQAYWGIGIETPQVIQGDKVMPYGEQIIVYDSCIMVAEKGIYVRKNGDVRNELHKAIDRLLLDVTHYWDQQIEESLK